MNSRFATAALLMLPAVSLLAQNQKGTLNGVVTDTAGAALPGARVELRSTPALTVTSNSSGQFSFVNLAPGQYTIVVSYVGFATKSDTVSVAPGNAATITEQLSVANASDQIFVTAERPHGEAEAINRELTSPNILQVLPFDVINSLPNTNIADAVGRLPSVTLERDEGEGKYVQIRGTEPRLSNVTINGVVVPSPEQSGVRQVKLDVVPANLVESVEINKTLQANQNADAIGGSVNLVTKQAGEKASWYLNGIGGYTPIIGGRSLAELDGSVGQRFGANHQFGVLVGGSYDWNGRGIDDVEPAPGIFTTNDGTQTFAGYNTEDLREYRYYRERWGTNGSLDWRTNEHNNFYFNYLFSHFNNFGDRWVWTPTICGNSNCPANGFVTPTLSDNFGQETFNSQIRRPVETIGTVQIGGNHVVFNRDIFRWNFAASRGSQEDHGYTTWDFAPTGDSLANNVVYSVDRTNTNRPKLLVQNGVNIYDPTQYVMTDYNTGFSYSAQLNLEGTLDYLHNYSVAGHQSTFQMGFKVRNAHKFNDPDNRYYNADATLPGGNAINMANLLTSFHNSGYYDKSYVLGPLTDPNKIRSAIINNPGLISFDSNKSILRTIPDRYDLVERVTAGYLMDSIEFGRVRLQGGVRFEGTNEDNLGFVVHQDVNGNFISATPSRANGSYIDPLPSISAQFRITDNAHIRAVYGRGLSRPNFGDLVPFQNINDKKNSISVGNPNLKAEYADNFDLLYEMGLKPLGVLQAGVYYKRITSPLVAVQTIVPSGTFAGFQQTQSVNGGSAHVGGFEVAYNHQWSFLPGVFGGLGISANYGYSTSQAKDVDPLRSDSPSLLRQAPNTWNVSPTYDRGRFSLRVGISHNDANIFQYNYEDLSAPGATPNPPLLGKKGPAGDIYLYAHTQVDAQGSIRVARGLQFIASGLNLTNEVFGFYQGSPQFPIQREYYKPTFSFGFRYQSGGEK